MVPFPKGDNQLVLLSGNHPCQPLSFSPTAANMDLTNHNIQVHRTDIAFNSFQGNQTYAGQAPGNCNDRKDFRQVVPQSQNTDVLRINAARFPAYSPQHPGPMAIQRCPPIYQLVNPAPTSAAFPGKQPLSNLEHSKSLHYAGKGLYNPNGKPTQSNDARVYYGAHIGPRFMNPSSYSNDTRLPENRLRAFSNASERGTNHQNRPISSTATVWVIGHENLPDAPDFLKNLFSVCGEVISVTPIFPRNGNQPFAFTE